MTAATLSAPLESPRSWPGKADAPPPAPTTPPPADVMPVPVRFDTGQYLSLHDAGLLGHGRTELVDGEILHMPPQKNDHAYFVTMLFRRFDRLLGDRFWVRCQATFRVGEHSMPEPDIALLEGPPHGGDDIPTTALLVVEVADTSLRYDRTVKASLYAAAGVPEYWIVNLVDRCVEVHHDPVDAPSASHGKAYRVVKRVAADAALTVPAAFGTDASPVTAIPVADVLP